MSQEGAEQNRSEQPTPFKLQRARERGSVARGMDLGFFAGLGTALLYAWMMGDALRVEIARAAQRTLAIAPQAPGSEQGLIEVVAAAMSAAARPLMGLLAAVFIVVLVFEIGQVRGLFFSAFPLKPDFSRLNPANGLKRVFSLRLLIETGKTVLKLFTYGAIAVFVVIGALRSADSLTDAATLSQALTRGALKMLAIFVLAALAFAILDQLIARRDFLKRMRMSRREVKREHKDREGDPRLKQRRKDLHKEFVKLSQSLRGVRSADVLITNPELVKTGLDLLEFPTIVFMQSGYNVYSLQQAARRSWRIGQKQPVRVIYLGYAGSSQMTCLELMAKKIMVSQSTSGDVPESGLDVLNQDGDSVEVALARQLVAA